MGQPTELFLANPSTDGKSSLQNILSVDVMQGIRFLIWDGLYIMPSVSPVIYLYSP